MKSLLLFCLLFQHPQSVIVEYDEFNDFTKIKTAKLYVLDTPAERMQFTFWTICKGNQSADCDTSPTASIGLLLKTDALAFSKSLKAIANGERFDLGDVLTIKTEQQGEWLFYSFMLSVPAETFQKLANAKSLKMQLGGVLAFSFDQSQLAAMKAMASKIGEKY